MTPAFRNAFDGTPTFLTVDVDFFEDSAYRYLCALTDLLRGNGIEPKAVMNHHQALSHVNDCGARRLVNVDAHSDIAEHSIDELNCGTWVSYVKWRHTGDYVWIRPDRSLNIGHCGFGFTMSETTDWKKARTVHAQAPTIEQYARMHVTGCTACMSPSYSTQRGIEGFRRWVKDYNVPYTRGLLNDDTYELATTPAELSGGQKLLSL